MRAFAASALHPSLPASQRGLRLARAQGPTGHGSVMEGGMRWRQSVLLVRAQARGARRLFQFLPKSAGEPECSGTPAPGSARTPANGLQEFKLTAELPRPASAAPADSDGVGPGCDA